MLGQVSVDNLKYYVWMRMGFLVSAKFTKKLLGSYRAGTWTRLSENMNYQLQKKNKNYMKGLDGGKWKHKL